MAANTSSGRFQSYPNPGPGTRIFQALDPDVVLIQELNVNSTRRGPNGPDAVEAWVDDVFGPDFFWFREPGGDSLPNGVISRWPILESGEWRDSSVGNRDFAFARIDIPGDVDLWVVSVHLLTRSLEARDSQARSLIEAIRNHPVPEEDFMIIGGDFNTRQRDEPAIATLSTLVDTLAPFPADGGDPPDGDTNSSRAKPYDWLLADAQFTALEVPVEIDGIPFPHGFVFDSRIFSQDELDQIFPPVRQGDSGAPQMQHMAVVRDFRIGKEPDPDPGPDPVPDFQIEISSLDFGTANASDPPRIDTSARIQVNRPFRLSNLAFDGTHSEEFALVSPDPADFPILLEAETPLTFSWTPASNDGETREITATLIADGEPGAVEIQLRGLAAPPDRPGDPATLDLEGFRLVQTGGNATIIFPAETVLPACGLVVIGRAVEREEFEAFWGALPPAVLYLNGEALAGNPGFPVINGRERYRLQDSEGGAMDPAAGQLPLSSTAKGKAYQRASTNGTAFEERNNPRQEATPGRYGGTSAGTGKAVITEISDATGPGGFPFEFVELYFDAPGCL